MPSVCKADKLFIVHISKLPRLFSESINVEAEALKTYSFKTIYASVPMGKSSCNLGIRFPKMLFSTPFLEEMGRGKHRTLDTEYWQRNLLFIWL